ncbi:MAG: hypothetical protein ACP5LR_09005, partial [Athalassotoga sp.]|uniref:hypothetical protein n=1 Tax=Athalassotoga sp. TaxID=2022597 RepID=UPI003CFF94C2
MIFILETNMASAFKDILSNSTASFKKINLYDRTVYITWGDNLNFDSKNVIKIPADGKIILSSRKWKNEDTI